MFAYADCLGCGTTYLVDPPFDLAPYYPSDYIRTGRVPRVVRERLRRRDLEPRLRLAAAQPGDTVLDVGCARGDFLVEMRRRGWTVAGIEPTAHLANEALALGIPVWADELASARVPARRFDLVTLWDVLEHLDDPHADLVRARSLLRPGGRLIVNTPLADGWDARVFGHAWSGWDAPRHYTVFTRTSLTRLLAGAGFAIESWHRVFETYLITALTLALAARRHAPPPAARAVWLWLHARPVRLGMEPVFAALDRAGGASSMAVVAVPSGQAQDRSAGEDGYEAAGVRSLVSAALTGSETEHLCA